MNIKSNNRRKFHRIKFEGQVNLNFNNASYNYCKIKNISLTGMFVTGDFKQQQSEKCQVDLLHRTKTEEIHLQASSEVVWSNTEGVALKFTAMTHNSYMSLLTTLIHEAELPVVILHEFPKTCPFEITNVQ